MMIKIGIDFSLNSPAVCVNVNDEYLHFISFFNDEGADWKNSKAKQWFYHNELYNKQIVEMIPYTRNTDKQSYRQEQKTKMRDAMMLADLICQRLLKFKELSDDIVIGIEGFSYSSQGASFIDLIIFNCFLRTKLVEQFGFDKINIISPNEGKKVFSGKGNANKEKMIEAFKNNFVQSEILAKSKLFEYINSIEIDYKKVPKPCDDLVDSAGICFSI